MKIFQALRRRFYGAAHAQLHPQLLVSTQRADFSSVSSHFQVKYVGCKMIACSTVLPAKAIEIANEISRKGPRRNKRRVSLTITPEEIIVNDTIHQCGLANFQKSDIGAVFSLPHDSRLLGIAIKDSNGPCCIIYIYKCSVKHFECKGSDVVKVCEDMNIISTFNPATTSTSTLPTATPVFSATTSSSTNMHTHTSSTVTSTSTTVPSTTSTASLTETTISSRSPSLCCSRSTCSLAHEQPFLSSHSSASSLASWSSWHHTLSKLPFHVTSNYNLKNMQSNLTHTFSYSCPALTLTQHTTSLFLHSTPVYSSYESSLATHSSSSSSETLFHVTSLPQLHHTPSPSSTHSYSSPNLSIPSLPTTDTTTALSRNILPSPYIYYLYETSSVPTQPNLEDNQDVDPMRCSWTSAYDSHINSSLSPENNGLSNYASHNDQLSSSPPRGYFDYDFVDDKHTAETSFSMYNSESTLAINDSDYSLSGESINLPTAVTTSSPESQEKTNDDDDDDVDYGNQTVPHHSFPSDHTYSYLFGSSAQKNTAQDDNVENEHVQFRPPKRISPYIRMMIKQIESSLGESGLQEEGSETESSENPSEDY